MTKLEKKIKLQYTLELLTGLHIGGNSENVEIGGIDLSVIKLATKNNEPYIPGSSLKGKMRCLLEQVNSVTQIGGCSKEKGHDDVNNLFGKAQGNDKGNCPSKLIVRDALLTDDSRAEFERVRDILDLPFTEAKWENTIDRKTAKANPRQIERVPAGAKFNVEFIINVWDTDNDGEKLIELLEKGIRLLESDYLGGSGSRGYGQVKFGKPKRTELSAATDWYERETQA